MRLDCRCTSVSGEDQLLVPTPNAIQVRSVKSMEFVTDRFINLDDRQAVSKCQRNQSDNVWTVRVNMRLDYDPAAIMAYRKGNATDGIQACKIAVTIAKMAAKTKSAKCADDTNDDEPVPPRYQCNLESSQS